MKQSLLYGLFLVNFLLGCGCKENSDPINFDVTYIHSVEIISSQAFKTNIDNFAHFISIDFPKYTDVTHVEIKLALAQGVTMEEPKELLSHYDLTKDASFKVRKDGQVILFRIKTNFIVTPLDPTLKGWEKKNDFGQLPSYLSVYKYTRKVSEKNVMAYIGVADMNDKSARFTILGEAQGAKTPQQFFDTSDKPKIVLNAGYFWDGHSLGLIIRDGKTVKPAQPMVWRNYNGASTVYYPTQGIFGVGEDGVFHSHWAYESSGKLFVYPNPSPNKTGEKPQEVPSDRFPTGAQQWAPKQAIGAGPILIKDGKYKNLWEQEMFDASSGIGPTVNNPRSAIGYTPSGHLVFFICEGRNKTANTPGLTLKEVADLLLDLGCSQALNLDGGGSSCMLINGKETIIPSDGKQRAVTNVVVMY